MFVLALIHALFDAKGNPLQRFLMLITLFIYGFILEYMGVISGNYRYASEPIMLFEVIPLSVTFSWVGIIYSVMFVGDLLELSPWLRILTSTLIALSLDWGMDPIATELGAWTWTYEGEYFGVPGFNFIGWFFIPIAYLIPYEMNWDSQSKTLQLLTIKQIDSHQSWARKLYTFFIIVPISAGILILVGIITKIPFLYNLNLLILVIWIILTVLISSVIIFWKRKNLRRKTWYDIIPPIILILLVFNFTFFGFLIGRFDLAILMIIIAFPLWSILAFTLIKARN
ncbi:MAG: carotenoid biosynthesis protein [Candidatus Thorarchaeota archaeon]